MQVNQYLQPTTHQQLVDALQQLDEKSYIVAAGTDFLAQRNNEAWTANTIVSITSLAELQTIKQEGKFLHIGSGCTHMQVADNSLIQQYYPSLVTACAAVGSVQIRNRATIGGNLANSSPAGDTIPVLKSLGATITVLNSHDQKKDITLDQLIIDTNKNSLAVGEIITGIIIPLPDANQRMAFVKLGNRSTVTVSRINIAANIGYDPAEEQITSARIYLGAVGKTVFRATIAEQVLLDGPLNIDIADKFAQAIALEVENSIPGRYSLPYKKRAAQGKAFDLLQQLFPHKSWVIN